VVDRHHLIAVEDFRPKLLAKTSMARKAADAAIGAAKRELIERGTRAGRNLLRVRREPISASDERDRAGADDVRHLTASFRDGGSDAVRAGSPGPAREGESPGFIRGDR
jgi:putative transposase